MPSPRSRAIITVRRADMLQSSIAASLRRRLCTWPYRSVLARNFLPRHGADPAFRFLLSEILSGISWQRGIVRGR